MAGKLDKVNCFFLLSKYLNKFLNLEDSSILLELTTKQSSFKLCLGNAQTLSQRQALGCIILSISMPGGNQLYFQTVAITANQFRALKGNFRCNQKFIRFINKNLTQKIPRRIYKKLLMIVITNLIQRSRNLLEDSRN